MQISYALCAVAIAAIISSIWTRGDKSFGLWFIAVISVIAAALHGAA